MFTQILVPMRFLVPQNNLLSILSVEGRGGVSSASSHVYSDYHPYISESASKADLTGLGHPQAVEIRVP